MGYVDGTITFGREGSPGDRIVRRDPPGFPDRGAKGLREDGLNAIHASIEIIYL